VHGAPPIRIDKESKQKLKLAIVYDYASLPIVGQLVKSGVFCLAGSSDPVTVATEKSIEYRV
jgi:hypothetical protein